MSSKYLQAYRLFVRISLVIGLSSGAVINAFAIELDYDGMKGSEGAPITIFEFSDFQCPFCAKVSPIVGQLLRQYPTQVQLVFKHYPLSFHRDAPSAHEAALAAGEQGKFWEMHDLLFANQGKLKREDLISHARKLGLDMDLFLAALDSGEYQAVVERDKAEGERLGVTGTPTFFINGKKLVGAQPISAFRDLIEKELSRLRLESVPPIADTSGGVSVKGSAEASVTVSVFADFQSPMSTQAAGTLRGILVHYPEKVRLIFKNFPLRFHPQAKLAHEAALAAGAQGKFWEMHDLLFENQKSLQPKHLPEYAERLGLDIAEFNQALEEHHFLEIVRQDILDGMNRDVRGVPTFFINGKQLDGAQTVLVLRAAIEEALALHASSAQGAQISQVHAELVE